MKRIHWLVCVLALATLALAAIGLLGLRSTAPVAAGETLVVDDDGMGTAGNCDSRIAAYSTIAAAVSAALPGDTIQVCPGTYSEQVVIDKANLTLQGPNAGVDPGCSGTRPSAEATIAWSTLTGIGTASTVVIAANGVTVDGFTIQNTNGTQNQVSVLIGGHFVGDTTRPSDGSGVRNNIISSGYNNVYAWQSSNNTIERNRALASVETQISIRDNDGQGTRDALRNSVLNNCIDKAGVTSPGHSVAIGVTGGGAQDFSGTLIQGNTMKNSGAGTGQVRGIDANLANGTVGNPVKIYGNTITDTSEGSIRIENSNYYDVGGSSSSTGNTITGSRGAVGGYRRGIGTAGTSTNLSIQYNTISGHSSTSPNDGEIVVTTSGNTILHNTLFVADSTPGGAGGIGLSAGSPSNVLGENTFQGNGQRMLVVSGAPGPGLAVVDATASTFKTASGTTLDPNSQTDLVSIEDRVRHYMDLPTNLDLVIFKANTTVATALNNATTPGAVQRAINAVPGPGSTVIVGPGTYNERVTIGKSLDIRGAQYGVDPTQPGARTTPANESTIDLTGLPLANPNVLIEIADGVSNVSLAGFTLIGSPTFHYADEAIVRAWDNDIAIQDNIMNGYIGVLYKGPGQNLQVLRTRTVFNKNGLVVQPGTLNNVTVSGNTFTLGSSPGGDESAIYLTATTQASVTGNTASGIAPNGRGLYGSNLTQLTASGNTFTGNKDAVNIFGSTTFITISNNDLSNSLRYGVTIKGQNINITDNHMANDAEAAVNIERNVIDTTGITVRDNDISGNSKFGIKVSTAQGVVISSNNILHFSQNGVRIDGSSNIDVSTNNIDGQGACNSSGTAGSSPDTDTRCYGVEWIDSTGTISGNTIAAVKVGTGTGAQTGVGIRASARSTKTTTVTIDHNVLSDYQKNGMAITGQYGGTVSATVDSNTATGWGPTGVIAQNGIQVDSGAVATLVNNEVSGHDYTPSTWAADGILTAQAGNGVIVSGNKVHDNMEGLDLEQTSGLLVDGNTVTSSRETGVYLLASDNATVSGNTITGAAQGLYLADSNNATVRDGTIKDNDQGIVIDGSSSNASIYRNDVLDNTGSSTSGIHVECYGACPSGIEIHSNNIVGNSPGPGAYGVYNDTTNVINATDNWWGACSGPYHPTRNPGGTGDAVSDYVDFDPWTGPCPTPTPTPTPTETLTPTPTDTATPTPTDTATSTPTNTPTPTDTATATATSTPTNTPTATPFPGDSDSDGMPDWWEQRYACLNPAVADAAADPDGDGLTNIQELGYGTNPCNADTDGDGCTDGQELTGPWPRPGSTGAYNPLAWYDFYDVPVPVSKDPIPNGIFAGYDSTNVDTDEALGDVPGHTARAQSFQYPYATNVTLAVLWVKKVGGPTDQLQLEIQPDASGLPSGTVITNGTSELISGGGVGTAFRWIGFKFATPPSLTANTRYHLVLKRTGPLSASDYYVWGGDTSSPSYADGAASVFNGSAWLSEAADKAFWAVAAKDRAVSLLDVLAVLKYVPSPPPYRTLNDTNVNGVAYNSDKDFDGRADGLDYDRSQSPLPNPPWDAGPPDGNISLLDVMAALKQVPLNCSQ